MATIVTTGQITIVDHNDARPITAYIAASQGTQQVFTKDESLESYVPNWATNNNVLTAYIYVGKTDAAELLDLSQLANAKWTKDSVSGTVLVTNSDYTVNGLTLTLKTNMSSDTPTTTYFFQADYTDPTTGLISHIIVQIGINLVKTGTNAVYMIVRGQTVIRKSNTAVKAVTAIAVNVVRAGGIDEEDITYKFFKDNGSTQIDAGDGAYFGLKTFLESSQPSGTLNDLNVNIPSTGAWSNHNGLIIHEDAVADMEVFRAVAKDEVGTEYQVFFTIHDTADPYEVKVFSSNGDKLQNGVGSTELKPIVYNGATKLSNEDLSAWKFKWYFYAANGVRAGFIDDTRTAVATGRNITGNTAGSTAVITFEGAVISVVEGDMVKLVTSTGGAYYYEVGVASNNNTITLREAIWSDFLNAAWPTRAITLNQFKYGKLFICSGTGVDPGESPTATAGTIVTTGAAASVIVDGVEIDNKGTVVVEAYRP